MSVDEESRLREAAEREVSARLRGGRATRRGARSPFRAPEPVPEPQAGPRARADRAGGRRARERTDRASPQPPDPPSQPPRREELIAGLAEAERELERRKSDEAALAHELEETERRLAENRERTVTALDQAAERLKEIEGRAVAAEQRAEHAQRLAEVKQEEIERTERLREMLERIAEAERRAYAAEQRARTAVDSVTTPIPEIDPAAIFSERPVDEPEPAELESAGSDPGTRRRRSRRRSGGLTPQSPLNPPLLDLELSLPPEPDPDAGGAIEAAADEPELDTASAAPVEGEGPGSIASGAETIAINPAELRAPAHARPFGDPDRTASSHSASRSGGFDSLDDIDAIPGFPARLPRRVQEAPEHLRRRGRIRPRAPRAA